MNYDYYAGLLKKYMDNLAFYFDYKLKFMVKLLF